MARKGDKAKGKAHASSRGGRGKRDGGGGRGNGNGKGSRCSSTRAIIRTPSPSRPSSPPIPLDPDHMNRQQLREWQGSKPRTHSMGKACDEIPKEPERVDIHGGYIFDDTAKKTILGIIRNNWPVGAYNYREIVAQDPQWLKNVRDKFGLFYKHKKGQSRYEVQESIDMHVKLTCKRFMSDEKRRLAKKMKETGLPAEQLCTSYFHPNLWDGLLKYWNSEAHKCRSTVGTSNRKKVATLHSAGAKPFEAHEMDMHKENKGVKPPPIKL